MTTITRVKSSAAVGYFRVSTMHQAGERHVSLDVQAASFNDYCRVHHFEHLATFTDIASGRKDDLAPRRPLLHRLE